MSGVRREGGTGASGWSAAELCGAALAGLGAGILAALALAAVR